jgi:predicted GH43/DUF377 family glycosyl hydrolase
LAITPLAYTQEAEGIVVSLTPYEGNPILNVGSSGSWDDGEIFGPAVVFHNGAYHMLYTGGRVNFSDGTLSVGYATSTDGLTWEKSESNPVFTADDTGFDADVVSVLGALMVEDDIWVLYYFAKPNFSTAEGYVGRATASDLTGPWTREENPVLSPGSAGEWDYPGVLPATVIATDEGYVMYYFGGDYNASTPGIGRATSVDGINWTKYDDPLTTEPPYAESDPVLLPGIEGWRNMNAVWGGSVRQTVEGWEMFFAEKGRAEGQSTASRIGYATSEDGIHWIKHEDFPALSFEDDPMTPSVPNLYPGALLVNDSTYYLYYYYDWHQAGGISIAVGTVARE